MYIKTELHCHNSFSNFHVGKDDSPYDSDIQIIDQLERSRAIGLDAIFVTNHNTLDGYRQMLKYVNEHERFKDIRVYPAEEITIDTGAHILAYGIHDTIQPDLPLGVVIDQIRDQGGISSAPHPFSLLNALRDEAKKCDLIEIFNSNNVDILSNTRAASFATEHNMTQVAGSDSHVLSTLGRCINTIESENNLDSILYSMKHGNVTISQTGYALQNETLEHLKYKITNSKEYLVDYISKHYPNSKWFFKQLLNIYEKNQDSYLWDIFYKIALYSTKRISQKINFQHHDPELMKDRNLGTIFRMTL